MSYRGWHTRGDPPSQGGTPIAHPPPPPGATTPSMPTAGIQFPTRPPPGPKAPTSGGWEGTKMANSSMDGGLSIWNPHPNMAQGGEVPGMDDMQGGAYQPPTSIQPSGTSQTASSGMSQGQSQGFTPPAAQQQQAQQQETPQPQGDEGTSALPSPQAPQDYTVGQSASNPAVRDNALDMVQRVYKYRQEKHGLRGGKGRAGYSQGGLVQSFEGGGSSCSGIIGDSCSNQQSPDLNSGGGFTSAGSLGSFGASGGGEIGGASSGGGGTN